MGTLGRYNRCVLCLVTLTLIVVILWIYNPSRKEKSLLNVNRNAGIHNDTQFMTIGSDLIDKNLSISMDIIHKSTQNTDIGHSNVDQETHPNDIANVSEQNKTNTLIKKPVTRLPYTDKQYMLDFLKRMNISKDDKRLFTHQLHYANWYAKSLLEKWACEHNDKRLRTIVSGFEKRLPDGIIIGCMKCGTSIFHEILRLHSRIAMKIIEAHYFDVEQEGLETYRMNMIHSFPDQLTMEKSPSYWTTKHAPEDIKHMNPNIKLILLVREPVCRVVSEYYHKVWKQRINETKLSFTDILTKAEHKTSLDAFMNQSYYDIHMANWMQTFSLEQIMIIRNEDLATPKISDILYQVEDFLNIHHELKAIEKKQTICLSGMNGIAPRCFPFRNSSGYCDKYYDKFGTYLDPLRTKLIPHTRKFETLVKRKFSWF